MMDGGWHYRGRKVTRGAYDQRVSRVTSTSVLGTIAVSDAATSRNCGLGTVLKMTCEGTGDNETDGWLMLSNRQNNLDFKGGPGT